MVELVGAVDIGGTKIAVGLVDAQGHILAQETCPTAQERGLEDGLQRIVGLLSACRERVVDGQLVGIGVGCTGPVDPHTGVLGPLTLLPQWEGTALVPRLVELTGVPVAIENDADAAALGEFAWGAGRGATHCVYVTISTGIGCGMIFDGRLYRGANGAHPELGHYVIDWSGGPLCYCGASGCWESLASGTAMASWYHARTGGPEVLDAGAICQRASAGEPLAQAAVEREADYIGIGLSNLINTFVPQVVVLGGGVMQSWDLFSMRIQALIQRNCSTVPYQYTQLRLASLGTRTGLAGAAQVWYHRFRAGNS